MKFVDITKENETDLVSNKIVSASIETDPMIISYQGLIFTLREELISISTQLWAKMYLLNSYWSQFSQLALSLAAEFKELRRIPIVSVISSGDHILHLSPIPTQVTPSKSHDSKN